MLRGVFSYAVLVAWSGPKVDTLHAAQGCVTGPGAVQGLLPTPHANLQSPIPEGTTQPCFAPLASRAHLDLHPVMRQAMLQSWARMRARALLHRIPHNIQHSSQNKTPYAHRCRPQGHTWTQSNARAQAMLMSTPGGTSSIRSGHQSQAHQPMLAFCCTPPCPPHPQSQAARPTPSGTRVSALAAHAHMQVSSCGFGRVAM